jgi:transmembrane sensor
MSPQLRERMAEWMRDSPENAQELLKVDAIAQEPDRLKLVDDSAQLPKPKPHSASIAFIPRRAVLLGIAAAVALPLGLYISTSDHNDAAIRHVTLEDGSVVHVLRDSDFDVDFSNDRRLIYLTDGEAVFDVAKDPGRPFIVRSRWSDSIAVGTSFGVVTDRSATTTTVSEGKVRVVVPAGNEQTSGTPLHAGQEIRVAAGTAAPGSVAAVDAERKTSWSTGWLAFEGATAGEAVKTFNRYSDVRIEIAEPELSNARLIYGRFELDKPQSFAVAVGTALNAQVTRNSARNVFYIGEPPQ